MKIKYIKSFTIAFIALISVACSYVDYVSNDSINISITDSTLNGREIRKGDPINFYLTSVSIDPDFPCYKLKKELYIDDKKIDIPGDTGDLTNSVLVTINTSNLAAGEHIMKIKSSGCNDMESTKIIKFTIVDGAPPMAVVTKTKLIAEPGKYDQLQVYVHYSASSKPVKTITLFSWGLDGTFDDKALDTLNIDKMEGDTLFSIYLYYKENYVLSLITSDGISRNYTDTIQYELKYNAIYDTVLTSNTTWTLVNSPYIVYGLLQIKGAKLTIEPGVVVRMGFESKIIVQPDAGSTLVAEGTAIDPIYLTREFIKCYGIVINANSSFKYCKLGLGKKIEVNSTSISFENSKADSLVLDNTSFFNSCNNNILDYLSIDASQISTIGVNNTITKQDVTGKK